MSGSSHLISFSMGGNATQQGNNIHIKASSMYSDSSTTMHAPSIMGVAGMVKGLVLDSGNNMITGDA